MPDIAVRSLTGDHLETVTLSDEVFGAPVNVPLMHQAVQRILASKRMGTSKAKSRSEVAGSGAKPWRQKGTGRARQGMRSSPLWRGGGVAFPPTPRSYAVRMPKKMRRQATRSALSARVIDGAILVVSGLMPTEAKTRSMVSALRSLEAQGKVLLIDQQIADETHRAGRNIPGVSFKPASTVNIVDVLNHDVLIFSVEGIRELEGLLSDANV